MREYISVAAMVTIFGYSAPKTDALAKKIFMSAWKVDNPEEKPVQRVEIIDVRDGNEVAMQWQEFAFFDHLDVRRSFYESFLSIYPRRSIEALAHRGFDGHFVESIPWAGNLKGVRDSVSALVDAENNKP